MPLNQETAHALRDRLQKGETTSKEITTAVLEHINAANNQFNAFISINADAALSAAEAIDQKRAAGVSLGPLAGIPLALKDVLCAKGSHTTCGSRILQNYIAPYDATVVAKLRQADAVFIGKTNMDEFAMGSSNENSAYGPVHNPHDPERVPGGSSGGSAAAVAAHQTILALGTDTGGSIRQPASYCGVVGLKPTYGRVSRYGLVAYASSLDQIGPLTKDVEDAALLLNAIAGHDPNDSTSVDYPVPDYTAQLTQDVRGLKVGLAKEHFAAGLDADVRHAVETAADRLKALGAEVVELSLPVAAHPDYCVGTYYLIATAEASANLSRYDGVKYGFRADTQDKGLQALYHETRSQGFGPEVKRRILLGAYALSAGYYDAYYLKAQKVRTLIRQDFNQAFNRCDVILSPVAPTTAFRLGEKVEDPLQMYLNDIYTASTNLAGLPGISVPVATQAQTGMPIGAQLLAAPFKEERLLNVAYALEQAVATTPIAA